jgi:hypothetical protein
MPHFTDFATTQTKLADILVHSPHFSLVPKNLAALKLPVKLAWQHVAFDQSQTAVVFDEPGVYAFAIQHDAVGLPPHGYVIYIGEVGSERRGARTLRRRFTEYFGEKVRPKRQHVTYFLNAWQTCLVFYFAPVDPKVVNLKTVEAALNDAMLPPYSVKDFSVEVRPMKRLAEMH